MKNRDYVLLILGKIERNFIPENSMDFILNIIKNYHTSKIFTNAM